MLHAGLGESHVNNLFSALNVPGIHRKSLKRREREAGKGLETLTKNSVSVGKARVIISKRIAQQLYKYFKDLV